MKQRHNNTTIHGSASICSVLVFLCLMPTVRALEIGDAAPSLKACAWLNGEAVDPAKPDGKTVYLIEFWATWGPACKLTVPHLNNMQAQFTNQQVVVVGVTDENEASVRAFMGDYPIAYRIALDQDKASTHAYLEGIRGIPHAFVIDRKGRIAWTGNALAVYPVLKKVLSDSFDPRQHSCIQLKKQELTRALQQQQTGKAHGFLDELITLDRGNLEFYQFKVHLHIQHKDRAGLASTQRRMVDDMQDATGLQQAAQHIMKLPLEWRDPELAWQAVNRAMALCEEKDAEVLNTYALVAHSLGLLDKAIDAQRKAATATTQPERRQLFEATLTYYKKVKRMRNDELK